MLEKNFLRRVYWQLAGVTVACVVVALVAVSYSSHRVFERGLLPETLEKAATLASSVRALVLKATAHVPFDSLYGVNLTFQEIIHANKEIDYAALTDERGIVLHQHGKVPPGVADFFSSEDILALLHDPKATWKGSSHGPKFYVSLPIVDKGRPVGVIHVGLAKDFVDKALLEAMLDVVVVLVVTFFFTLELLNYMVGARLASSLGEFSRLLERIRAGDLTASGRARANDEIGRSLRGLEANLEKLNARYQQLARELEGRRRDGNAALKQRLTSASEALQALHARFRFGVAPADEAGSQDLTRVRAPLFMFILAEEMTRSFLPAFVSALQVEIPGLSPQVVISLPIILFMLIVAIGQPYLGSWSERVGRRRAMLLGAAVATVGFATTALSRNIFDLVLWRSLCAIGYAMVYVAAQGYILDRSNAGNRAQGFALFIGATMVAAVCGPSIGGILADNLGFRVAFALAALICAISIAAVASLPEKARNADAKPSRPPRLDEIVTLMGNRRFMAVAALAAMPAKILQTGICLYLVPLYILATENSTAVAGRMIMVYAILMVLVVPRAAKLADAGGVRRDRYVSLGLIISGLSGMLLLVSGGILAVFAVAFLLGLGQAMSSAAQGALVGDNCQEEIRVYGADAVYGAYRLLERLGSALGPLLASLLLVAFGYPGAFAGLSGLGLACGIAFTLLQRAPATLPQPARS